MGSNPIKDPLEFHSQIMKIPWKDVTQYTEGELDHIWITNKQLAQNIRDVYVGMITDVEGEHGRLNTTLSDFTQRSSALMTVSGLLAFLPSLIDIHAAYLQYFLIWTFPFLIIAIICFYPSSIRISAFSTQMPTASAGSALELIFLKARVVALQDIWRMNLKHYNKVLEWYRITTAFIYIYIFSFTINFYLFTFLGEPNLCISIIILLSVLVLGSCILFKGKMQSRKGVNYGPTQHEIGIGGGPID
jgi:hypothetical protein